MRTLSAPPPSAAEPVTEFLHGIKVIDPYRWLEDQNSPRTREWIEEQTSYARAYLDEVPGREQTRSRVKELLKLKGGISEVWNVGNWFFFLKRQKKSEQAVIALRAGLFGEEKVLVDPASRGEGNHTAVSILAISNDARFLAYSVRQSGTDHSSLEIFDVQSNTVLPDRLPDGSCHGFVFAPDSSGFYYSHRLLRDERSNGCAVQWHAFGMARSQDKEVFSVNERDNLFATVLCSPEAQSLLYPVFSTGKSPCTSLFLQALPHGLEKPRLLLGEIEGCFVPFFIKDQLFAYTDFLAPNFRIVRIDISSPDPAHWRDIVPESKLRIQQFAVVGEQIFITRIDRFTTNLQAFRLQGGGKGTPVLSVCGSIDFLNCDSKSDFLLYSHTSIEQPPAVHCYRTSDKKKHIFEKVESLTGPYDIDVQQVSYPSRDGTSIPLLLAARKDVLHSGPLPAFLTGYGGFGNCVTPRFTAFASFLIEQGFLFAVPALRGGAELGETWHRAGMREKRQNSFNDFIAAAEWLIEEGRAKSSGIALGGGSNAGLLVGAAITQRPDLFRAAICLGPLLDMARYHLFDSAAGWSAEYGSPENEQDCKYLLGYSPYHRVRDGIAYPAVLLISGDGDTRCNPMHARKMCARLQAATISGYPILLDHQAAWGHMPVQPLSTKIEALVDRLSFVCNELGTHVHPKRPN